MNIGYKLVKNAMPATAAKAPYLGMAIPVGSLAYDNSLKEMIKAGTKMTQPTAKFFLDALYEYAAETIAADVVRINLGNVAIYPMIDGSFDSEDAPFDPKRNTLYVGASISQDLRDRVAGIAPDYAGDVSLGTVKLHSCMDLASGTFKAIDGTNPFRLAGANLTVPDAEDESLALYAKDGVTKVTDIVVTETDGGQQITCQLSAAVAVPKGTYKVRLASHGLDPTDPLTVATLTVTLVEAIPEPSRIDETPDGLLGISSVTEGGQSGEFEFGRTWDVAGHGFDFGTSEGQWTVGDITLKTSPDASAGAMFITDGSTSATAFHIVPNGSGTLPPVGEHQDAVLLFALSRTTGGRTEEFTLRIPVNLVVRD